MDATPGTWELTGEPPCRRECLPRRSGPPRRRAVLRSVRLLCITACIVGREGSVGGALGAVHVVAWVDDNDRC
uniref:Uncharacterized protein n=1 Tax=Arundo donax TaxID=35708 RepID=A0A0A9C6L8_ARUDO